MRTMGVELLLRVVDRRQEQGGWRVVFVVRSAECLRCSFRDQEAGLRQAGEDGQNRGSQRQDETRIHGASPTVVREGAWWSSFSIGWIPRLTRSFDDEKKPPHSLRTAQAWHGSRYSFFQSEIDARE